MNIARSKMFPPALVYNLKALPVVRPCLKPLTEMVGRKARTHPVFI